MDGTLDYALDAGPTGQSSNPVTPGSSAPEDNSGTSNCARLDAFWACWCIVLATVQHLRQQVIDLRTQANYWQSLHQRAVLREAKLKEDKQLLQAQVRELRQRLFGSKSETSSSADPNSPATPATARSRRRGHRPGAPSQGRRNHDHLATVEENCTLAAEQRCCPTCHEPYEEIPGTVDGSILEVEVRAYRRRYHRQRYRRH
jgi:hypothetical protein